MAFHFTNSRSPDNFYVYNFSTRKYQKLTEILQPEIDAEDLVDAKLVRFSSFDGLRIPALLYKPHRIEPGENAPAVVVVHGGPGTQSRIFYYPIVQFLVNQGYVVLDVN